MQAELDYSNQINSKFNLQQFFKKFIRSKQVASETHHHHHHHNSPHSNQGGDDHSIKAQDNSGKSEFPNDSQGKEESIQGSPGSKSSDLTPALIRKAAMRKKELLLNSFYMNDFGESREEFKKVYRMNQRSLMIYPEFKPKIKWDLFITL